MEEVRARSHLILIMSSSILKFVYLRDNLLSSLEGIENTKTGEATLPSWESNNFADITSCTSKFGGPFILLSHTNEGKIFIPAD
ncbi:hypothetical protein L1887_00925 [Cichorium endivia]|nr:hypothetical protein L1887_00925 [Cichorium endivia]